MLFKTPISKADDEKLSRLIRMKRQEKPDDAFWETFDEELRSKQLAALVRTQTWYERLGKLSVVLARKSAAATAMACIFTLGVFTISKMELFSGLSPQADSLPMEAVTFSGETTAPEPPLFVVEENRLPTEGNESEFAYRIDTPPTYEVNVLTKRSVPVSYQIMAEPKQFTVGRDAAGNSLGAKVIRTGNQF